MPTLEQRKKMCFDKKPYPSRESALADSTLTRSGYRRLNPYKCPEAGDHWHLTKSKPRSG